MEPFSAANLALEALSASLLVMTRLTELQQKRAAEGRKVSPDDVAALMREGDLKAATERGQLAFAKLAQEQS